ncbi:hypothetical protein WME94_34420 [Sorangium sp. So ce429]
MKLSDDEVGYLKAGYHEALVYRAEYDKDLSGWPNAILVVSSDTAIKGAPRCQDDVIAVSWKGLLDGLKGGGYGDEGCNGTGAAEQAVAAGGRPGVAPLGSVARR